MVNLRGQIGGKMKQRAMRRKMRKRRTGLRIIAFVVLLLCGLVSFKRIELNAELTKAKTEMVHKNKELKVEEAYKTN